MNEVLDTKPEIQDSPQAIALSEKADYKIAFENVPFITTGTTTNLF